MYLTKTISLFILVIAIPTSYAQQGRGGRGGIAAGQSPAAVRPATKTPQSYPAAQVKAGESRFGSQCGFCHGRDAEGGESGPDLTHSALVAEDTRGDKIGPLIRAGLPAKGMPSFSLPDGDVAAIVAFIHDAKTKAEAESGGRRSVDAEDLQTGNIEAGKRYFNGSGGCAKCHSIAGSFATVASRFQGLALLQRMLYPSSGRGPGAAAVQPTITVIPAKGEQVTGKFAYRDEFTITLIDSDGWNRSWPIGTVKIDSEDPLRAHSELLGKYSDQDIHDLFAYLQTLK